MVAQRSAADPSRAAYGGAVCLRAFPPLTAAPPRSADKLVTASLTLLPDSQQNLFSERCIADTDLAVMLNRLVLYGDALPDKLRD